MFDFKTLNDLSKDIHAANIAKGFWDREPNVGELLMLVTSELGEALEAHRHGKRVDLKYIEVYKVSSAVIEEPHNSFFKENIKDTFEDEIADAVIRLFDMAGGLGIDLAFHVQAKLEYNKSRPHKHGKAY